MHYKCPEWLTRPGWVIFSPQCYRNRSFHTICDPTSVTRKSTDLAPKHLRSLLTIVQDLLTIVRNLVLKFTRFEFCFDSFLVRKNGWSKGFFKGKKYAEVQNSIFLSFRSSASVRKSIIFENCRLRKLDTQSKTQKNKIFDFCVFFP